MGWLTGLITVEFRKNKKIKSDTDVRLNLEFSPAIPRDAKQKTTAATR